jgi:hypothetical protein
MGSCRAYIGAVGVRQAIKQNAADCPSGPASLELQQFHLDEPFLKQPSRLRSACRAQDCSTERLAGQEAARPANSTMASTAPNLRRRSCYVNSRLLQLPRPHWVQPRWRRPRPPPGAAMAGITAAGTMAAGVLADPASTSEARATLTAAAMRDDWSRRRGDPAGAW